MTEQRSKRRETENASRVDYLLGLLRDVSQRDPSPALRERLVVLASQRLRRKSSSVAWLRNTAWKGLVWLKPAFAVGLIVTAGLATVFVVRFRQHKPAQSDSTATVTHPAASPGRTARIAPATEPPAVRRPGVHHPRTTLALPTSAEQMTMQLPYSNSAIETGTDTTIRVSMSQSELLSLGFPINATVQDRRIVAELTLGDDGLPRAISLPLPLEVLKEKK